MNKAVDALDPSEGEPMLDVEWGVHVINTNRVLKELLTLGKSITEFLEICFHFLTMNQPSILNHMNLNSIDVYKKNCGCEADTRFLFFSRG